MAGWGSSKSHARLAFPLCCRRHVVGFFSLPFFMCRSFVARRSPFHHLGYSLLGKHVFSPHFPCQTHQTHLTSSYRSTLLGSHSSISALTSIPVPFFKTHYEPLTKEDAQGTRHRACNGLCSADMDADLQESSHCVCSALVLDDTKGIPATDPIYVLHFLR